MGLALLRNKRGFMLTLLAIVLSTFFITVFSARINNLPDYKVDVVESRIMVMDYYMENFFKFAESAGTLSGYAALQGILYDMNTTPKHYALNFTDEFPVCALNGSLPAKDCPGMNASNLEMLLLNMSQAAERELKINTTFQINNISVTQTKDPFYLELKFNLTVTVTDKNNLAILNSTRYTVSKVPIVGLYDPIYLLDGTYTKKITAANMSKIDGTWLPADLIEIYNTSSYRFTSFGVTFLDRIRGNFTTSGVAYNNSLGIESFIEHNRTEVQGLINSNVSFVDHLFWSRVKFNCQNSDPWEIARINPAAIPGITSSPPFQLDMKHITAFQLNVTNVSKTPGCP